MAININNFFSNNNKDSTIGDFQDIEHIDGVAISSISANLYTSKRVRKIITISGLVGVKKFHLISNLDKNLSIVFFI